MSFTVRARRWKRQILFGAILHLTFLVVAPVAHHDLECHLKTPLHCAACAISPLTPAPKTVHALAPVHLDDAGRATVLVVAVTGTLLPVRSSGRSPPVLVLS
ncbi:MAG TPA: hypothetical protein VJP86_15995 [Vicinamibacterales bacterium]|jgi:hypothetical protein|nr:hypothetical protein [Vicinamibacterales bacterium]